MAKTRCKDPVSSETVRLVGTAMKDKWGDSRKGTSLALPLRCIRETEYFRGSLRPQCGSTGRKGGTTLSAFEALRDGQSSSVFLKTCLEN